MFLAPQVSQVKGLLTFLFVKVFQHLKLIKPIKKRLVFARRLRSPKNEKLYMNVSLVSASVGRQLYHPVILGFDSLCEMYFHRRRCCLEDIQSTCFFCLFLFIGARWLQRPLEACVFHTGARRELHQNDGQSDQRGPVPAAHQRHQGPHFWRLCVTHLGVKASISGWDVSNNLHFTNRSFFCSEKMLKDHKNSWKPFRWHDYKNKSSNFTGHDLKNSFYVFTECNFVNI